MPPTHPRRRVDGSRIPKDTSSPEYSHSPAKDVCCTGGEVVRSRQNIGGARGRPTATHVWDRVQAELAKPSDAPDASLDDAAKLDGLRRPWILFLTMLLGNGWFLKLAFFDQRTGNNPKDNVKRRIRIALMRAVIFVAGWIAAFALLPFWIPSVALVAWSVMIAPKIHAVNKAFQNVGPGEEPS